MNPRNQWWPIAFIEDIKCGKVYSFKLMGDPLCVFRNESGDVACLADRCLHRGIQLSLGRVEGNNLQTIYHGWEYAIDGSVVNIPSIDREACRLKSMHVYSYPVRESCDRLYVWPGVKNLVDSFPLTRPLFSSNDSEYSNWRFLFTKTWDMEGVCPLVAMENQSDFSHGPFTHHGTVADRKMAQILHPIIGQSDLGAIFGPKFRGQLFEKLEMNLEDGTELIQYLDVQTFTQYLITGKNGQPWTLNVIQLIPMGPLRTRHLLSTFVNRKCLMGVLMKIPGMKLMLSGVYDKAFQQDLQLLQQLTVNVGMGCSSLLNAMPADSMSSLVRASFKKALYAAQDETSVTPQDAFYSIRMRGCWFQEWLPLNKSNGHLSKFERIVADSVDSITNDRQSIVI
jgi:nitrite reductase/ring-hydroxylating ferredoxin subunit